HRVPAHPGEVRICCTVRTVHPRGWITVPLRRNVRPSFCETVSTPPPFHVPDHLPFGHPRQQVIGPPLDLGLLVRAGPAHVQHGAVLVDALHGGALGLVHTLRARPVSTPNP